LKYIEKYVFYILPDVPCGNKMLHHPCVLLIAYMGYIHKWQTLDEVAEFQYGLQIAISVQTRPKKEIQKIYTSSYAKFEGDSISAVRI